MNTGFIQFREALFAQGLFSTDHVHLHFPNFNTDNLLYWQKKGYIMKLRNKWYCFMEFPAVPDSHFLIANQLYTPSYISHQEALAFYGMIPEHIVDSTSVTTKKTNSFKVLGRYYKYYSLKPELFFGYRLMSLTMNGIERNFLIAEKEKAILDLLYLFSFYKTQVDMEELRLNQHIMENEINWVKLDGYLKRFNSKTLISKMSVLKKVYKND